MISEGFGEMFEGDSPADMCVGKFPLVSTDHTGRLQVAVAGGSSSLAGEEGGAFSVQ